MNIDLISWLIDRFIDIQFPVLFLLLMYHGDYYNAIIFFAVSTFYYFGVRLGGFGSCIQHTRKSSFKQEPREES
jgi:hypothetical protein